MTVNAPILTVARAEALFTSLLTTGCQPSRAVAEEAIRHAVRTYGGVRGCAAEVAGEYGDHPESAAPRMRWARRVVAELYEGRPGECWALVA